jgi:hypothetical protein
VIRLNHVIFYKDMNKYEMLAYLSLIYNQRWCYFFVSLKSVQHDIIIVRTWNIWTGEIKMFCVWELRIQLLNLLTV